MVFGSLSQAWWIVGIGCLVVGSFVLVEWYKEKWRKHFSSTEQDPVLFGRDFVWHRFLRNLFLVLSAILFSFVLLDPRWGMVNRSERIEGVDIVLVVDLSQSMLCEDVGESRLERLRRIVFDLMSKGGNHRLGLVFFSAQAYPIVPLTFDYEILSLWLQEANPLAIENQGSNLEDGLRKAIELFEKNTLSHQLIVVFSDGEDMEHHPLRAATQAAQKGIRVVTIGIGTEKGGKIPLRDEKTKQQVFLTADGKEVVTRLRPDILREIAKRTGGVFLSGGENAADSLLSYVEKIKKNPYGRVSYETMMTRYQYFLVLALLFWLLAILWPTGRGILVSFLVFFGIVVLPSPGFSHEGARGTQFYREGRYQEAKEAFQKALIKKPSSLPLRYNLGNTLYYLQEWENAIKEFRNLTNVPSQEMAYRSLYNLGTTLAAQGNTNAAAVVYHTLLRRLSPKHPLYTKTVDNLIYLQQAPSQKSPSPNSQASSSPEREQENKDKTSSSSKDSSSLQGDTQSLLNLVQQEERKNMQKLPLGGGSPQSRYPW
ncbi:MAG: VWA domain-containing protein [Brevinematales bacterium]|nr:VWA domain-containing protein [Brevinematales bacterium]